MIPKTIHYCWFGRNPLPKLAKKCKKSWKRYCPDYEIIEWNEDNYDLSSAPLYVRQAYEAKKWAFVTDYVRLHVVYEHGGIYMDTDVELIKKIDPLLEYDAYFGFEDGQHIATGLGFGAEKGAPVLKELMNDYADILFILEDGSFDLKPCPVRNTEVFLRHGLKQDDSRQVLADNILILPSINLCPYDYHLKPKGNLNEAYSIHWFSASWYDEVSRKALYDWRKEERRDRLIHLPNRALIKLLGQTNYNKLKKMLGRK
jgi:hypothetical protein